MRIQCEAKSSFILFLDKDFHRAIYNLLDNFRALVYSNCQNCLKIQNMEGSFGIRQKSNCCIYSFTVIHSKTLFQIDALNSVIAEQNANCQVKVPVQLL